jgi:putative transposase
MSEGARNRGLERSKYELRSDGIRDTKSSLRSGIHTRGYLPHVKRQGAAYFVTFRLADSLPREVLLRFDQERAERLRNLPNQKPTECAEINRDLQRKIERYLDSGAGACCLRRPDIADMVAEALHYYHTTQYLLDDWVIMPNHVHLIIWPMPNHTLSEILSSRKRHTARQANLLLQRTGEPFWQPEAYDHWIRNDEERRGFGDTSGVTQ